MLLHFLWHALSLSSVLSAQLPAFVDKCSRSSPKLQSCIANQIPTIIEGLREGDEELGLVPLDPLKIPRLEFELGHKNTLELILNNFYMSGLSNVEVTRVLVDPEDDRIELDMFFRKVYIRTDYAVEGTVSGFEVDSVGPAEMHFANVTVNMKIRFYRWIVSKVTYFRFPGKENFKVNLKIGRHGMRFESLVRNDAEITESLNSVINNNFQFYFNNIKGGLADIVRGIVKKIFEPFLSKVPIKHFYIE